MLLLSLFTLKSMPIFIFEMCLLLSRNDYQSLFVFKCTRCFASTGEASSVDEYLWLMGRAQYKPIIEYCGGTEIGGGFVTGSLLQAQSLAAFSTPAMGCSLFIVGDDGNVLVSSIYLILCE